MTPKQIEQIIDEKVEERVREELQNVGYEGDTSTDDEGPKNHIAKKKSMSRRSFLKTATLGAGSLAMLTSGTTAWFSVGDNIGSGGSTGDTSISDISPATSVLDMSDQYITFEGFEGSDYYLGGGTITDSETSGIKIEASANPSDGSPLFVVESSGSSERLRVEHNGVLSTSNSNIEANGNTVWHQGNDGSGSGLNADTVDGQHASQLGGASAQHFRATNTQNPQGSSNTTQIYSNSGDIVVTHIKSTVSNSDGGGFTNNAVLNYQGGGSDSFGRSSSGSNDGTSEYWAADLNGTNGQTVSSIDHYAEDGGGASSTTCTITIAGYVIQ